MSFSIKTQQPHGSYESHVIPLSENSQLTEQIESTMSNIQETADGKYLYHPYENIPVKQQIVRHSGQKLDDFLFTRPQYQPDEIIYDNIQNKWIFVKSTETYKKI